MNVLVFIFLAPQVHAACSVDVGGRVFDFSSVESKQVFYNDSEYDFAFTFCRPGPQPCSGDSSSLCQTSRISRWETSLGLWETAKWSFSDQGLIAVFNGTYCDTHFRTTTIKFVCQNDTAAFLSWREPTTCVYEAVISVPFRVCGSCCSPQTFAKKVLVTERGGLPFMAVVQQDQQLGDSYDGTGALVHLCSKYYNRCFDYEAVQCFGSPYAPPPPPECVAANSLVGSYPVVRGNPINQTVWATTAGYVTTVPLGSGCIIVGGTYRNPAMDVSSTPDEALWEIPEQCLRLLKK